MLLIQFNLRDIADGIIEDFFHPWKKQRAAKGKTFGGPTDMFYKEFSLETLRPPISRGLLWAKDCLFKL